MEPKPVEKLFKADEIEPCNGQTEASLFSGNPQVENYMEAKKDASEDIASHLSASEKEVLNAYLASEQHWEEVYRRLADS